MSRVLVGTRARARRRAPPAPAGGLEPRSARGGRGRGDESVIFGAFAKYMLGLLSALRFRHASDTCDMVALGFIK